MPIGLSVVIPAYNEEANVARCLTGINEVLSGLDLDSEIILVNDGSTDKTNKVARSFLKKIPRLKIVENQPNRGYGGSLRRGFAAASGNLIVFVPADNQFDFSEVQKLISAQSLHQADIVSGIRPHGGKDPLHRRFFRWGWNSLVRGLFGFLAEDIDCGFKLFKRKILDPVHLTSDGAMIDTQLLAGARARGMRVVEIPVTHFPRTAGKSTGGNPRVIAKAIKELFGYWWQLKQEILVEQGRAVFRWEALLMLVTLAIAAFFRLWRIGEYLTFLGDEGRDVLVVRDMLLGNKFTLIGPGTSIGGMYLGPLYYYLMLIPLWLFKFSPVGPAIQVAGLGTAAVGLIWWIGRQWFGRVPALAISFLYALSPTAIIYSRSSWNPNIMPFFALITVYGIWKVWRYGYWRWLIITAAGLAFVLNSHYLGLLLIPLIGIFWFFSPRKSKNKRYTLAAIVTLAVLLSPLLFFDMRHGWINSRAVYDFFSRRQTTVNLRPYKAVPNLWPIYRDITSSLVAAKDQKLGTVSAVIIAVGILYVIGKSGAGKISRDLMFVLVWFGFGLLGLSLYKQHVYDHYFGFIFPVPFFLLGFIFKSFSESKYTKIIAVLFFAVTVIINIRNSPLRYPPNRQLQHTGQIADFIKQESHNQPFNLALIAKTNYDAGYRYFLAMNQAPFYTIHQKITDQLYVICEIPESAGGCNPIGHPLWEVASFGWAKIDSQWDFPWGVKLFRLIHNPEGK